MAEKIFFDVQALNPHVKIVCGSFQPNGSSAVDNDDQHWNRVDCSARGNRFFYRYPGCKISGPAFRSMLIGTECSRRLVKFNLVQLMLQVAKLLSLTS
jgi:hypothetical protein